MKAQISELWDTGIEIISIVGGTFDENGFRDDKITSFSDLRKCENILVDKRVKGCPYTTIMIDDKLVDVSFRIVSHPSGGGKLYICEIV